MGGDRYSGPMPDEAEGGAAADAAGLAADLSRRFRDRLRLFATRRLRDATAGEDVAQETLRRVVEALRAGRVTNLDALPGFAFQTALHVCLQHQRSRGREARALQRLGPEIASERSADPLLELIDAERRAAVQRALARLGDSDRELLRMLFSLALDMKEVATRLGVAPEAVRVRKHRALRRLEESLQSEREIGNERPRSGTQ
jgi:RNA polymerase sigma factor (sigma-70 family)